MKENLNFTDVCSASRQRQAGPRQTWYHVYSSACNSNETNYKLCSWHVGAVFSRRVPSPVPHPTSSRIPSGRLLDINSYSWRFVCVATARLRQKRAEQREKPPANQPAKNEKTTPSSTQITTMDRNAGREGTAVVCRFITFKEK